MLHRQPLSTFFPYTTLFRSERARRARGTPSASALRRRRRAVRTSDRSGRTPAPRRARARLPSSTRREARKKERSEEHTSELQSLRHLVCRLLLEKQKQVSTQ